MRKSITATQCLLVSILSLFLLFGPLLAGDSQAGESKIYSELLLQMASVESDQMVKIMITFTDRVDTRAMAAQYTTRQARHEAVVTSLQSKAEIVQADILLALEEYKQLGSVAEYKGYWLGNMVFADAYPEVVLELARRPEVHMIFPNYPIELIEPVGKPEIVPAAPGAPESGLLECNVRPMWDLGFDGTGVILMNYDTGVDGTHPALSGNWHGNTVPWQEAWLNTDNPSDPFPNDPGGHGTHTMGTIAGVAPATQDTIGMAPGATWIAAGWTWYGDLPRFYDDAAEAFQWAADPDGNPNTSDDVPAACGNSWGTGTLFGQPPCDASYDAAIIDLEAAGCAVIFAAGNEGPGAGTLRNPSERINSDLQVFSVGALEAGSNLIASFSSRGPTDCPGTDDERIKPEVSARGVNVRSSYFGSYANLSGTSMACPHVTGAIGLLAQAFPNATVDDLKRSLYDTAVDLGTPGEDNTYGTGRIDVFAAYQQLLGGGGGIPCGDISSFVARCNNAGSLQMRTRFTDNSHDGETVTYTIDGSDVHVVTIANRRAQLSLPNYGIGAHTVALTDPAGCVSDIAVTCNVLQADGNKQLESEGNIPSTMVLEQNFPNPFNPTTNIRYGLSEDAQVRVKIFNALGQQVRTLVSEAQAAGYHTVEWDGKDDAGNQLATGMYVYRMQAGDVIQSRKMLFSK